MIPALPFKRLKYHKPHSVSERDARIDGVEILYEDEALLAVNKPPCLPMHANLDLSREHLVGVLERQLERRDGSCGYLGLHQRLDWGTSGVVVFTRSKAANASLARQFSEHSLTKIYAALVHGNLWPGREAKRVEVPLGAPQRKGGRVQPDGPGSLPAATVFRILQRCRSGAWVAAYLETGRKHQVRAHLFSLGIHIYGDLLYGGNIRKAAQRPMLHSLQLTLQHPFTGQTLNIAAPVPEDMQHLAAQLSLDREPPFSRL